MEKEVQYVDVNNIIPNRFQPRLVFDEDALNELATSISQHGIIQPLVLRRLKDKYEIIAGERRYKAACMVNIGKVPAIIMNLDDNTSAEVALVENIQRKDLTAIEEAKSYKNLLDRGYLKQDELAIKLGKSQSNIANKIRLLQLDEAVQVSLLNNQISERHARSLLAIKDPELQVKLLSKIINDRLTVRQTDEQVKELLENGAENFNFEKTANYTFFTPEVDTKDLLTAAKPTFIEDNNNLDINNFGVLKKDEDDEIDREFEMFINNRGNVKQINPHIEFASTINDKSYSTDIRTAINTIKKSIATLEKYNFKVNSEEFDFEDLYQIIIKIKK